MDFSEFSLLEIEKRISEISNQRSGGKEKTRKCDEEENFSVLRWRERDFTTEDTEFTEKRKAKALPQR